MDTTNWTKLLRLALRRDRVYLTCWIVGLVALGTLFVPIFPQVAGSEAEMATLGEMMNNPAMVAMCGLRYGGDYTMAIMYTQMMLVWMALAFAAMSILLVARHTRGDEEAGRLEVLRSLPVGRSANLLAVAVLAVIANAIPAALIGLIMPVFQVDTIDLPGSLVSGAALGACGLVFAAFTLIVAQVMPSSRGTTGVAMAAMGVAYLVRAYGDVSAPNVALATPFGLIEKTEPFYTNAYWPVWVSLGAAVILGAVGLWLNRARDLGLGLLPQRPGRAHAPRLLGGELGLGWRLIRGTLIAWAATVFVVAAAYGSVMGDMAGFIESSEVYQQLMQVTPGQADLVSPIVATLQLIMAIIGAVPVILAVNRLAGEEKKGRLDQVYGTAASRRRLFLGHALLAGLAAVVMQLLAGLGFGLIARSAMKTNPVDLGLVLRVAANYWPALLAFGGLALCLVGWAKRAAAVTWAYLVAAFLLAYLGGMLDLPRWAGRLTPFGLLQRYPVEAFSLWPWLGLVVAAVALAWAGLVGYRRRDIT
jgi:ABC-2 type transport system permease protein